MTLIKQLSQLRKYSQRKLLRWLVGDIGTKNQATREAWLMQVLSAIDPGSRILDAGAGELKYKRYCSHLDYISQDFAQYDGKGDGVGLQTGSWDQSAVDIISDITQIPELDASFDAVMCIEVLEHVPYPTEALRELSRLLRPDGVLILSAPFTSLTHYAPYYFQSGYSRYFYEYWLPKFGLEIVDMQWNGNYFDFLAQELRRLSTIGKQYATGTINWLDGIANTILLRRLNKYSRKDRGSNQLLAYGIHIYARKTGVEKN